MWDGDCGGSNIGISNYIINLDYVDWIMFL